MMINCEVTNGYTKSVTFLPHFQTFVRTTFGKIVETEKLEHQEVTLNSKEKRTVSYKIPKTFSSQAYDAIFELRGNTDEISNQIKLHYVIQGSSATIQNIILDKNSYKKGETAKAEFLWSLSADSFSDSRASSELESKNNIANVEIIIVDNDTKNCSERKKIQLDNKVQEEKIDLPINKNCLYPNIIAEIKDSKGRVLDFKKIAIRTEEVSNDAQSAIKENDKNKENEKTNSKIIILSIILVIIIAVITFLIIRRKRSANSNLFRILVFILILPTMLLFGGIKDAKADVFNSNGVVFTVSLSGEINPKAPITRFSTGSKFYAGTKMNVATAVRTLVCANNGGSGPIKVEGIVNGAKKTLLISEGLVLGDGTSGVNGENTIFDLQDIPGDYVADFIFTVNGKTANGSIKYTVIPYPETGICGSANGGTFATEPPESSLCSSGIASYFYGSGSYGDYDVYRWSCFGETTSEDCMAYKDVAPKFSFYGSWYDYEKNRFRLTYQTYGVDYCVASNSTGTLQDNNQWNKDIYNLNDGYPQNSIVNPSQHGMFYYLECFDTIGKSLGKQSVYVSEAIPMVLPPWLNFGATPNPISLGMSTKLTWVVSNATSCTASGSWNGEKSIAGGSEVVYPTLNPSYYYIQCENKNGDLVSAYEKIEVKGAPSAPPSLDFSASKTNIEDGESITLNWFPQNVDYCKATSSEMNSDGGWTTKKDFFNDFDFKASSLLIHSQEVSPKKNTTYYLQCWKGLFGSEFTERKEVTIKLASTPTYACIDLKCSLPENCEKPVELTCVDSNGDVADPQSLCEPACQTVTCPDCSNTPLNGNWKEVAP